MPSSRFIQLPPPLCPGGVPSLAALVQRDNQALSSARLYLGRNYVFTGTAPDSYFLLASITAFALHGKLAEDFAADAALTPVDNALPAEAADWPDPLPLTAGLQVQLDGIDVILPDVSDFDALAATVLLIVGDEFMAIAEQQMTAAGAYTLTVIRGAFGTAITDHRIGDEIYIIAKSALVPLQHSHFRAGNTIQTKLTLANPNVADVAAQTFVHTAPQLWSISPALHLPAVAFDLDLHGANFTNVGGETVTISGHAPISGAALIFSDATKVTVPGLTLAVGVYDVTYTNANGSITLAGALTVALSAWTSITPDTVTAMQLTPAFAVVGTGFAGSGITGIKLDDGNGNSGELAFSVDSDTSITIAASDNGILASLYTLYYTINGSDWVSTGLTVRASL